MDAHSRRQAALDAIAAVLGGSDAGDVESEVVDFKEEKGTFDPKAMTRVPIGPRHEPAAQALAAEVACMAMSESGGALVIGIDDKSSGHNAFVGSYLDTEWLRGRIHALTMPHLAIDVIEELHEGGARLYLINVAPALEEIRVGGKLRARHGTDCLELDGDRAREFLERRRRFDWTGEPSGMRFSQMDERALASAHRHYEEENGRGAGSDLELTRRLGVLLDDGDDPELNRAGAMLLGDFDPQVDQIQILVTPVEGTTAQIHETFRTPLILAFDEVWSLLRENFPAETVVVGAQRRRVRAIPDAALRESVVNAMMHRDYRLPLGSIVAVATGNPTSALKVTSPGGFPSGVPQERLLAARSQPPNPALAHAMRALGLGDMEGVGIDTMYRVMLRDGHHKPDIYEEAGDVICRLSGGQVDSAVREFFDELYSREQLLESDARAHIIIIELLNRSPIRPEDVADAAQCSEEEAMEILERLASAGGVERLLNGSRSFRLTRAAQGLLSQRLAYPTRHSLDDAWDLIRAYLDVHDFITRADVMELLGVQGPRASQTLSQLYNTRGVIKPAGARRGRNVRYVLA